MRTHPILLASVLTQLCAIMLLPQVLAVLAFTISLIALALAYSRSEIKQLSQWGVALVILLSLIVPVAADKLSASSTATAVETVVLHMDPRLDPVLLASLLEIQRTQGTRAAIDRVELLIKEDPKKAQGGHDYVHAVGIVALQKYPTPAAAYAACDDRFTQGCLHGVVTGYLLGHPTTNVARLCEDVFKAPYIAGENSCWHAIGHGMSHQDHTDVQKVLEACDKMAGAGKWESCWDGAVMENIITALRDDAQGEVRKEGLEKYLSNAAPFYPCSQLAARYLDVCYRQIATQVRHVAKNDLKAGVNLCVSAPTPRYASSCQYGLGQLRGGVTPEEGKEALVACRGLTVGSDECLAGALGNQYLTYSEVLSNCPGIANEDMRSRCYGLVGYKLRTSELSNTERAATCAKLEERYKRVCLSTGGLQ